MKFPKLSIWLLLLGLLVLGGAVLSISAAGGVNGTPTSIANNLRQPSGNTKGLIAWYPLDGDSKDYSVTNNNATPTNFTYDGTSNGWTDGKFGKGLLFNGSTNYLDIGTNANTELTSTGTVSVWAKPSVSQLTYATLIDKQQTGSNNPYSIGFDATGSTFQAAVGSFSGQNVISSSSSYAVNQWYFLVLTWNGTTVSLYQNNQLVASTAQTYNSATGTGKLSVGSVLDNAGTHKFFFKGSIDDVRIYNRALSNSELSQLYAGSSSQNCDQTCRIWLKFDDNTGTSANDSVGTYPATLNGTTAWTTGNFASAVGLDGSTGYASVPNLGLTSGTVDIWINPTIVSGDQRLFTQASGGAAQAGQIALNQSSGENGSLWVYDGTAWQRLSADGTVKAGQWNQIVVANNGGTATAYVNGTQQLTAAAAFAFSGVAANIGGKFLGTTGGTFNGSVDDFRVYTRILAPEEVADQWRLGT